MATLEAVYLALRNAFGLKCAGAQAFHDVWCVEMTRNFTLAAPPAREALVTALHLGLQAAWPRPCPASIRIPYVPGPELPDSLSSSNSPNPNNGL